MSEAEKAKPPISVRMVEASNVKPAANVEEKPAEQGGDLLADEAPAANVAVAEDPFVSAGNDDDIFADGLVAVDTGAVLGELDDVLEGVGDAENDDTIDVSGPLGEIAGAEDEDSQGGTIIIHKQDCLRCTELTPALEKNDTIKAKRFKDCHFSKGNDACPAKGIRIVIGVPIPKIIRSILESEEAGDFARLTKIMSRVAAVDETQQEIIQDELKKARAKKATASASV